MPRPYLRRGKLYDSGEHGNIERELEIAVPALLKVGLFDLFPPDECIKGGNPGRGFVGELTKNIEPISSASSAEPADA
jgi:hypothetical protein